MQSQPVSPPPMTNTSNPCDVIGVEFGVVYRLSPLLPPPPSYHPLIIIINIIIIIIIIIFIIVIIMFLFSQ